MRLPRLAGLRFGGEALFTTERAGMFGADDTGLNSSLVGRRKKIPCSFHLVSPSVKINAVNDASSPSWLDVDGSGGVRSCMVMHEVLRHRCPRRFARASWSPRPTRTRQRGGPRLLSPMQGPSRKQLSPPRRLLDPPVSRYVQELGAQVPACGAIAVPSRCTCIDYCSPRVLVCTMLCKLHSHGRRGR